MFETRVRIDGDIGPVHISGWVARQHNIQIGVEAELPAAIAGMISEAISGTEAELAMSDAGHGLVEGDIVDLYWDGGVRYGCDVDGVDGVTVLVSGGHGDDVPEAATAIAVAKVQTISTVVFPDLTAFAAMADARVLLRCTNAEGTDMFATELNAGEIWEWWDDSVRESPIARGIGAVLYASQAGLSAAAGLKIGIGV